MLRKLARLRKTIATSLFALAPAPLWAQGYAFPAQAQQAQQAQQAAAYQAYAQNYAAMQQAYMQAQAAYYYGYNPYANGGYAESGI